MARAEKLKEELEGALKIKADVLSMYRAWLDKNRIPAEDDGWPSEDAYNPNNIRMFIEEERS